MKKTLLALSLLALAGCAKRQACSYPALIGIGIPTIGIYPAIVSGMCLEYEAEQRAQKRTEWAGQEIRQCIREGGDPARCRAAIYPAYGFGVPETNVNIYR